MVTFTFIVCAEPYKYEAMDTLLNLGESIIKKGHQILGFFFYGSGVLNIKKREITSDSFRNLPERLEQFCKTHKASLTACSTWISFTGMKKEEFIKEACQEGLGALSDLVARSDKVVFFGPGG